MHQYRIWADLLESSAAEKNLGGILMDKLTISQQEGQWYLGVY